MEDKQEQIEEMAYSICTANRKLIKSCRECPIFQGYKYPCVKKEFAEKFYNVGCRMQSDTARGFAEKLKEVIHERDYISGYAEIGLCEEIDEIAAQYGVEVEE